VDVPRQPLLKVLVIHHANISMCQPGIQLGPEKEPPTLRTLSSKALGRQQSPVHWASTEVPVPTSTSGGLDVPADCLPRPLPHTPRPTMSLSGPRSASRPAGEGSAPC
jgi:hypothetical protein